MPTKTAHEKAAKDNQLALNYCLARVNDFPQWTTVSAFYTAVHVVEALFAVNNEHSDEHHERNDKLKRTKRFQQIWKHYQPLFNDSLIARYLQSDMTRGQFYDSFADYMPAEDVVAIHVNHNLHQIIASVRRLLKDDDFLK